MKPLFFAVGAVFCAVFLVWAQNTDTCVRRLPGTYNFSLLAWEFLISIPGDPVFEGIIPASWIPASCSITDAAQIVKYFCKTANVTDTNWYNVTLKKGNYENTDKLDPNAKLGFMIHGFLGACKKDWTNRMADLLKGIDFMNVCCVDWSEWAECNYVPDATVYVPRVGIELGGVIRNMTEGDDALFAREDIIVIGHSFGGHIAGFAGKEVTDPKLPLCVALDPAGYGFSKPFLVDPSERLAPDDYNITKGIYTDAGGLGSPISFTAISVWANGGYQQPACSAPFISPIPCNHFHSVDVFMESIVPNQTRLFGYTEFLDDTVVDYFTLYGVTNTTGEFYLRTSACAPFNYD